MFSELLPIWSGGKYIVNDPMNVNALCPYYLRHSKSKAPRGVSHEIICASICSTQKLGFETEQLTRLNSNEEYKAFTEIFCCDMYETCPVYKAILSSREAEAEAEESRAREQRQAGAVERKRRRQEEESHTMGIGHRLRPDMQRRNIRDLKSHWCYKNA